MPEEFLKAFYLDRAEGGMEKGLPSYPSPELGSDVPKSHDQMTPQRVGGGEAVNHLVQEWLFAAAIVSSLVSMAGLYVSVASQRSQLAVQIMLQYSEKFRLMLVAMPPEVLAARHDRQHAVKPGPEISRQAISLFFILLELHYLRERRYLPMGIWNLWLPSVRNALKSPVFLSEWELLRVDFVPHHASFCRFIDSLQK